MAVILDGKSLSEELFSRIKAKVTRVENQIGRPPKLVIFLIGNDGASKTYVENKLLACKKVGIESLLIHHDKISEKKLEEEIIAQNLDKHVDGIIVQMPLPDHMSTDHIINTINPKKDVDGLHPFNLGKMTLGLHSHKPATPKGILEILKKYKIETAGKHCVVLGRSRIIGRPISILMSRNEDPGNCTVTVCHSKTENLTEYTQSADILISALGKPHFIKKDMVKKGAVIIDVGITRVEDKSAPKGYRIEGDVDFEDVAPKVGYITPVPGGVGPLTIASLLKNTVNSASYNFEGV